MAQTGEMTTVLGICQNKRLIVPDFQRNFSWQTDNIDDFHTDIKVSIDKQREHFLGSTILKPEYENKFYSIIDGQQRFTTIFMYVAIIRDLISKLTVHHIDGEYFDENPISDANKFIFFETPTGQVVYRFQANYLLNSFFRDHVLLSKNKKPMPVRHQYWSLDLRKAYKHILDLFEEDFVQKKFEPTIDDEKKLKYLHTFLKKIFSLTILSVNAETLPEAYSIFMTLNNRGVNLNPADLVKSLFMQYQTEGMGDRIEIDRLNNQIQLEWKTLTDNLGDNKENSDPNVFLRHYLVSELDSAVQSSRIFDEINQIIQKRKVVDAITQPTPKANASWLLSQLIAKSQIYTRLLDPKGKINNKNIKEICYKLSFLTQSWKIIMLKVLDEDIKLSEVQREEITRIVEILTLRWLITNANAQNLENIFQNVCKLLRQENVNYDEIIRVLSNAMPSDLAVKAQFHAEINKPNLVKVVLHSINRELYDKSGAVGYDPKTLQLEHIIPENSTNWIGKLYKSDDEARDIKYSSLTENWGNKTLLDFKINASIRNESFQVKQNGLPNKDGYKNSSVGLTKEFLKFKEWNEELVFARNSWISECFIKIWSITSQIKTLVTFSDYLKNLGNNKDLHRFLI